MINTYKKEFTVAKWSEVKLILQNKGFSMDSRKFPNWEGLKYISEFSLFGFFSELIELKKENKIDFINFDE